jgi:dTDP-4-amino-4,6-dideoxygalactose transaminase
LANARSGISLIVDLLSPARVWLPSYLCSAILQAIDGRVTNKRFHRVGDDLVVSSHDWLTELVPGDLVILIDYFGLPCDSSCGILAKERGAWVLEDACQALLSALVGQSSDFVLYSPRKFLGVPDGGILTFRCDFCIPGMDLTSPPTEWWHQALLVTLLRREFDSQRGSRRWFKLFQEVERRQPLGHYAMSPLAKTLLLHGFSYSTIAQRRIDNYGLLADRLGGIALFPTLPPGAVPLGFPIRVADRDWIRHKLFERETYPPVHWPVPDLVPQEFKESRRLSYQIMTLPCDQRYGAGEMSDMAEIVLRELGS